MSALAFQVTSNSIVCSTACWHHQQRKQQRLNIAGHLWEESTCTSWFSQTTSNSENVSMSLRRHEPVILALIWYQYLAGPAVTGLIIGLRPANEIRRYKVTPSLIWLDANLESALCKPSNYVKLSLWESEPAIDKAVNWLRATSFSNIVYLIFVSRYFRHEIWFKRQSQSKALIEL